MRIHTAAFMAMVAASVALTAPPPPVSAQDERESCRCVDADGNEIENCTCFHAPSLDGVMPRLALFGDRRARLGISLDVRSAPDADVEGALVVDVLEDGPADQAGLREGDVITHVDGRSLAEPIGAEAERDFDLDGSVPAQRLIALARELEPGESVELVYVRDGRQQTTTVRAEELSGRWGIGGRPFPPAVDAERMRDRLRGLRDGTHAWSFRTDPDGELFFRRDGPAGDVHVFEGPGADLRALDGPGVGFMFGRAGLARGLELVEVSPGLGKYFGIERGVLVAAVGRESTLGLEPGDVILSVDAREVTDPAQLRRILASYTRDEEVELTVQRDGERITLTGPMRRP